MWDWIIIVFKILLNKEIYRIEEINLIGLYVMLLM